jgi:hypothetical protein
MTFSDSALRQVAFARESDEIEVVAVHHAPPSQRQAVTVASPKGPCIVGSLQAEVLGRVNSSAGADGVTDLREVRQALAGRYLHNSVSRAVHQLVTLGLLEPVRPTGAGFLPDDGRHGQVRFVRRAAAS